MYITVTIREPHLHMQTAFKEQKTIIYIGVPVLNSVRGLFVCLFVCLQYACIIHVHICVYIYVVLLLSPGLC